jgi:hypothetical protein
VLQAIHLLLAFPLFVVVVAVDARWVSYALQDQYPHLLVDPESSGNADRPTSTAASASLHSASPRDYLEKIFQVPYWVQPMDEDGCRRLLGHLTSSDLQSPASDAAPSGSTAAVVIDGTQEPDVEGPATPANVSAQPVVNKPGEPDPVVNRPGVPGPTIQEPEKTPVPAGLRLEELEVTAMKELAPIIGRSPREVKRFVNVYRILKAAIPAQALPGFIGTSLHRGEFRCPMLLLAISAGIPRIGRILMHQIAST